MRELILEFIKEGLIFTPEFIKKNSDKGYMDVVTHEDYNELVNLNTSQGDYNSEVLRILFTEEDPEKTYHIAYLDKAMTDEFGKVYEELDAVNERVDEVDKTLEEHVERMDTIQKEYQEVHTEMEDIKSGKTAVPHAQRADMVTGVESAGPRMYYGTDLNQAIGFHELPPMIYADDINVGEADITPITILPRENSVNESMLTDAVKEKLNRQEGVTDYDYLENRPAINSHILTGDLSLLELGIQPAGNYLTKVPDTYSTTEQVNTLISNAIANADILTTAKAATIYATTANLNTVKSTADSAYSRTTTNANNITSIKSTYNRVGVNAYPSSPIKGDLYIVV